MERPNPFVGCLYANQFLRIFQAVALLGIGDDQNKEPSIDHDELKGQKRPIDAGPYYMNKLTTVSSITTCLYVCTVHEWTNVYCQNEES